MPRKRKAAVSTQATVVGSRVRRDDEIGWVAEALNDRLPPKADEAPSPAAWNLYLWASTEPENASKFWTQMYKSVAGKEKGDTGTITDDQRKFFRLFEVLERERPELLNDSFPRNTPGDTDSTIAPVVGVESCLVASGPSTQV